MTSAQPVVGPVRAAGSAEPSATVAPEAAAPPDEALPDGVGFLDPYEVGDGEPTALRFAHATGRGVMVHVGTGPELGVDGSFVELHKTSPAAVLGVAPAVDIVPLMPTTPLKEADGTWEVFSGDEKVCEGPLVDLERAAYLRNLDGQRSMGCQEVAEGLGAPLSRDDIQDHYNQMTGLGFDVTARVAGCAAPRAPAFLWARPKGAGPAPADIRRWAIDGSAAAGELYARTTGSPAWRELAGRIRDAYAQALPGERVPSRMRRDRRVGADNGLGGWSVFAQLGNTMDWHLKVTPVAETTLWDVYPDEAGAPPLLRLRVKHALDVEMVASGHFGDGVELVAIVRSQCHDKWLMLGRQGRSLRVRRDVTFTCWCSD